MIRITEQLETMLQPQILQEDEYIARSGRIHCRKCGTARQLSIRVNDRILMPRCKCACQKEEADRLEQERKHREFLDRVARNRSLGLPDPVLRKYTFENDLGHNPRQTEIAKNYVENWEAFRKESTGLLLWGGLGTGKSYLAGCIANALLDRGVKVLMTNFPRIIETVSGPGCGDKVAFLDSLNSYDLLILDDLGAERDTSYAKELVFHIVDNRRRCQKPMILTTNLTPEQMKQETDLDRKRSYERILESCIQVRVNNGNIREENRKEALKKLRPLLEQQ